MITTLTDAVLNRVPARAQVDPTGNRRLSWLERINARAQEKSRKYRAGLAAGTTTFEKSRHDIIHNPYLGVLPCHAAGLDFVMFHANDDVVAKVYLWEGADGYETEIVDTWVDWCRRAGGEVLDIGGYSGLMSILAAQANPDNVIHLFEPLDSVMERANINIVLNGFNRRIMRHNYALSDRNSDLHINIFRDHNVLPTGSSLSEKPNLDAVKRRLIQAVTLDSHMPGAAPQVVKLDVEGHELAALRGMHAILSRARPRMVVEVWEATRPQTLGLLRDLGYQLERVEPRDQPVNNYFALPPGG